MKKIERLLFSEMEIDKEYDTILLLKGWQEKECIQKDSTYVQMNIFDGKENKIAKIFNCTISNLEYLGIRPGMLVFARIRVYEYNDKLQYQVTFMAPYMDNEYKLSDYTELNDFDANEAYDFIIKRLSRYIEEKTEPEDTISQLTKNIIEEVKEKFIEIPAGKTIHHSELGGLLRHTYTMLKNAIDLCETSYDKLDNELLECGVILHDIGKIEEMALEQPNNVSYTTKGKLIGHSAIGAMYIHNEASKGNYDMERVWRLAHIVLSHHRFNDKYSYGKTILKEAFIVHALDMVDAKIDNIDKVYETIGQMYA